MKKIAITQRLIENTSYEEIREVLDINYAKFINEAGYLPIALPYKVNFIEYFLHNSSYFLFISRVLHFLSHNYSNFIDRN